MNSWTLSFTDPQHESMYQELIKSNMHIPLLFRIATYAVIILQVGYRVLAICSAYTGGTVKTGTFLEELHAGVFILFCIGIEVLLRATGKCRHLWGLSLYVAFPVATIAAAYYTQRAPRFGSL